MLLFFFSPTICSMCGKKFNQSMRWRILSLFLSSLLFQLRSKKQKKRQRIEKHRPKWKRNKKKQSKLRLLPFSFFSDLFLSHSVLFCIRVRELIVNWLRCSMFFFNALATKPNREKKLFIQSVLNKFWRWRFTLQILAWNS